MLKEYFTNEEYEELRMSDDLIYKSLEIICRVFNDKLDKGGLPYSIHLLKVYAGVNDYLEKVCALLHDIIEDTNVTYDDLFSIGYDVEVMDILFILTKVKGEDYRHYIERIINSNNVHALNIKLADLRHNMDIKRISNPTINDYERVNKRYIPAYEKITNKLRELEDKKSVRH